MKPLRWLAGAVVFGVAVCVALMLSHGGRLQSRGELRGGSVEASAIRERESLQRAASAAVAQRSRADAPDKQILFGDLHVHTTYSPDAFALSLPILGGEGSRPPAMACDFARHCSALDFWSINDHAEGLTPRRWRETTKAIRECNAAAGDPRNPDLAAFLGWEWSQVAWNKDAHWGHKNVVLLDTEPDRVPRRPIAAPREQLASAPIGRPVQWLLALSDWENRDAYLDFQAYFDETAATPFCEYGVDTRALPENCMERARDPRELFEKLEQWGLPSIVIPHGNAWGLNTPPGTTFDKQLNEAQHDGRQSLVEIYSGHGNSEEYRSWRAVEHDDAGAAQCPAPTDDFLPCCWRAGEIIAERCLASGEEPAECDARAVEARRNHAAASVTGYWTVPGTQVEDWLECGQCTDCFNASFDHRPGTSTQYALALSKPGAAEDGEPLRFRFGFIGSSDNHRARPGTGYKEFGRRRNTEANGPTQERLMGLMGDTREPAPQSQRFDRGVTELNLQQLRHMERQASFFMTGGLVAAHSDGRSREAVFDALLRKEVYATSGERILLWFDVIDDAGVHPMGSELRRAQAPRFRARAVGAFEQKPGCPEHARQALGADGIAELCLGECYHPSDTRRAITRIEVVRIHPQRSLDEAFDQLIEDPWRIFICDEDPAGCTVEFDDREFAGRERDTVYYVRAIQEPTDAVNAGGLRCEREADGSCSLPHPCYADPRTAFDDDCLSPNEERAWSSPIFVDFVAPSDPDPDLSEASPAIWAAAR